MAAGASHAWTWTTYEHLTVKVQKEAKWLASPPPGGAVRL